MTNKPQRAQLQVRTVESMKALLASLHAAAFAQFSEECNAAHETLLEAGVGVEAHLERRAHVERALMACLPNRTPSRHHLAAAFARTFQELRLDVRFEEVVAVIEELPCTETGNQRMRTMELAVSRLVVAARERRGRKELNSPGMSPIEVVQTLERALSPDTTRNPVPLRSDATSMGLHPDNDMMHLGSFADVSAQFRPVHHAALLLVYCIWRRTFFSDVILRNRSYSGLSRAQLRAEIRDYSDLSTSLAPKLRELMRGPRGVIGPPKWIAEASKVGLKPYLALLQTFDGRSTPGKHLIEAAALIGQPDDEPLDERKRLFDEILFLIRPVGPPKKGEPCPDVLRRAELVSRLLAEHATGSESALTERRLG